MLAQMICATRCSRGLASKQRFAGRTVLSISRLVLAVACLFLALDSWAQQPGAKGIISDWSTRHVLYTDSLNTSAGLQAQKDPRWLASWVQRNASLLRAAAPTTAAPTSGTVTAAPSAILPGTVSGGTPFPVRVSPSKPDWSFSLNGGTVAAAQFPAKFTIDITQNPDCVSDFLAMGLNIAGAAGQANLVGLNRLYVNSTNTGYCAGSSTPNTLFAYRITNPLATSIVLSEDGTKIAFVENLSPPKFHVLAWKSGQGTVTAAVAPTLIVGVPPAGSGQYNSLSLAAGTGTSLSSPYIDYDNDVAYVGTDNGKVYRIKNVFCTTAACISSPAAPSLDATWSTNPVSAGAATNKLTAPVLDYNRYNLFVGGSDGKLYGFNAATGASLGTITVGDGTADGNILDPPMVDGSNGFVYAVSGSAAAGAVLVQAKTDFSSSTTLKIGTAGKIHLHDGAFNDVYYSQLTNGSPKQWFLYLCTVGTTGTTEFHRVNFNASRVIQTDNYLFQISATTDECSPFTEILNAGTDRLFGSVLGTTQVVGSVDITSDTAPAGAAASAAEPGGSSAIVIDNMAAAGTYPQASSIYFATQTKSNNCGTNVYCAVKLTQSALQ